MLAKDDKTSTTKSEATRNALILAARQVMAKKGIANTRIADIVNKAKVSHGTFYVYFKNKDDIVSEVVNPVLDKLYDAASISWDKGDIRASIEHAVRSYMEIYSSNADAMGIFVDGSREDEILRRFYLDARRRFNRRILKNLEKASEAGLTRKVDLNIASFAMANMVDSFAYHWYCLTPPEHREALGFDEICKTLTDLWFNAVYGE